jgi:hypothetical protein
MVEEIQKREEVDRSPFHGLWTLSNRELKKWYKAPVILLLSIIQPIFWISLFGKAMSLQNLFPVQLFQYLG